MGYFAALSPLLPHDIPPADVVIIDDDFEEETKLTVKKDHKPMLSDRENAAKGRKRRMRAPKFFRKIWRTCSAV